MRLVWSISVLAAVAIGGASRRSMAQCPNPGVTLESYLRVLALNPGYDSLLQVYHANPRDDRVDASYSPELGATRYVIWPRGFPIGKTVLSAVAGCIYYLGLRQLNTLGWAQALPPMPVADSASLTAYVTSVARFTNPTGLDAKVDSVEVEQEDSKGHLGGRHVTVFASWRRIVQRSADEWAAVSFRFDVAANGRITGFAIMPNDSCLGSSECW